MVGTLVSLKTFSSSALNTALPVTALRAWKSKFVNSLTLFPNKSLAWVLTPILPKSALKGAITIPPVVTAKADCLKSKPPCAPDAISRNCIRPSKAPLKLAPAVNPPTANFAVCLTPNNSLVLFLTASSSNSLFISLRNLFFNASCIVFLICCLAT